MVLRWKKKKKFARSEVVEVEDTREREEKGKEGNVFMFVLNDAGLSVAWRLVFAQ